MERTFAWIGYTNQLEPWSREVKLDHNLDVDGLLDAKEGLEATANKQYPLILVNDVVPAGDLVLPGQIRLDDVLEIGCHIIRKIRSEGQNMETPIIVTHMGRFTGYDPVTHMGDLREYNPETAVQMYKEAGATECFNIHSRAFETLTLSQFAEVVGKYL